jgi:hypothetical protein
MPLDLDLARDADGAQALCLADREVLRIVRPSPTRNSAPSNRLLDWKRGNPAFPWRSFNRRKNALKALSSRLSTCCSAE